jgi:hypothetical protein
MLSRHADATTQWSVSVLWRCIILNYFVARQTEKDEKFIYIRWKKAHYSIWGIWLQGFLAAPSAHPSSPVAADYHCVSLFSTMPE